MIKYFTPKESKDSPKNQKPAGNNNQSGFGPSKLTMSMILGYSAALKVIKTNTLGNLDILLN
jgi:hypothetical protein